jgi:uncharacterized membrane protein required for colicin V production
MIIDILFLIFLVYGIYLGYEHGVFRVAIMATSILLGLFLSMYLTDPAAHFIANFFGFHYKLLPLSVFLCLIFLLAIVGILIFKKTEKKLKNTEIGKTEKYFGAVIMSLFFSFVYAIILNFFTASKAIKTEIRESSFTYTALETFSDGGIEIIKKLVPFVNTFTQTISAEEISNEKRENKPQN